MENSKYYGGRDISGRLITEDESIGLLEPVSILIIDNIEDEYKALVEELDGKDVAIN